MKIVRLLLLIVCLLTGCTAIQTTPPPALQPTPNSVILEPTGHIQPIHDPVLTQEGDTYYVYSTGSRLIIHCSQDMVEWRWCGRVFERNPGWVTDAIPGVGDLWAPDISFFAGKWHLYYSASTFGSNRSLIGLVTNVTLDPESPAYAWSDEGEVIASRPGDDWNAIDPNLAFDAAGQPWLAFGSYWSGIKLRKIDPASGKLAADDPQLYALATRSRSGGAPGAIEAAFIIQHDGAYYLFVSFDACCQGAASTYHVRVGQRHPDHRPLPGSRRQSHARRRWHPASVRLRPLAWPRPQWNFSSRRYRLVGLPCLRCARSGRPQAADRGVDLG